MSCDACRDIEQKDGVAPPCREGACPVPPLTEENARLMEMRSTLVRLKDLVDSWAVLRMYGATRQDLEMLAVVEEELKALEHGRGD